VSMEEASLSLSYHQEFRSYKKGEIIFQEAGAGAGIFYVIKGTVKLSIREKKSKEMILRLIRPNSILGHEILSESEIYLTTAEALEDSECYFITKENLLSGVQSDHRLALYLIKILSGEVNEAYQRGNTFVQKSVRERLAHLLLSSTGQLPALSREEIASLIGTVSETVIRCISEFKEQKWIIEEDKRLKITNREALLKLAGLSSK
jgi:CRP/FNR family transcriptional regulator, polysaccharide utilization system transcription regulator